MYRFKPSTVSDGGDGGDSGEVSPDFLSLSMSTLSLSVVFLVLLKIFWVLPLEFVRIRLISSSLASSKENDREIVLGLVGLVGEGDLLRESFFSIHCNMRRTSS
jgi:hypothetical protein